MDNRTVKCKYKVTELLVSLSSGGNVVMSSSIFSKLREGFIKIYREIHNII